MTVYDIVREVLNNAIDNGYSHEIEALSDEDLAWDMFEQGVFEDSFIEFLEVVNAINKYRG